MSFEDPLARVGQLIMFEGCVFFQWLSEEDVWFSSKAHRAVSARMAELCSNGAMPCGQIDESTPVTWQLVRGAAVADPQVHLSPACNVSRTLRLRPLQSTLYCASPPVLSLQPRLPFHPSCL